MEPPVFRPAALATLRAAPGSAATLILSLPTGTPPIHYEWSRAGASLDDRFTSSQDAGGVRLTVSAARAGDSGVYTLQATNAAGKDTARVRLEVSADEAPTGDDPPTFLRRLQDLTVKVGTRTRFLVEIVSSTECKVTWYCNERRLMEAERVSLVRDGTFWCADIAAVSVDDTGRWTCTAENAGGRASCSAHLNVLVPKAYKRPEFVEELRALLTEQGTVSLECKVVGVPTPVLRWFKDSREIKAGDVFALTANAEDPTSLGTYTCEAVNCMGRAYSSSKVHVVGRSREGSARPLSSGVTPESPPIFTKELEDKFVRICEPLTLSCHIVVPPWPRSVVWYNKEGKVEPSERYHAVEDGVGGYLLELPSSEWPDEGEWKCVATSSGGRVGISSCYVSMDVPKNYRKPRFMENLQAVLTEEGLVSFECKVVGFPTPVLSWFKDGQELKPGDVYQLTGTNSLGSYCCIARNCMGQASSSAELTVEDIQNQLNEEEKAHLFSKNQAPKFIQGLKSIEAKIDEPFRFTIKVAIPPEPSVQWYRDEQPVDESTRCHLGKEDRGGFYLDIQSLEFLDQAEWKCVALNDYGHSVTSCFLKLIIPRHYKKPRFLENLQAILSDEGAVNLECKVIGVPQPVLKWYKDGEELKPGDIHRIISGQDGTCCLGTYTCEAQNCMGIAASSASLLGFDDSMKSKTNKKAEEQALQRNLSLSTIHEERTSQMYDTPVGDITLDDKGEISFSFDGKEVSVSLYETPDLTEEEALQIVEMYADQLSENVTEHNVVELPPLRFVKETSTSGNLLMEAIIIDVSPEYFASPEEDLRTEADVEDISIADEMGPPQLSLDQDIGGEDYLEKTMALLSDEKADIPKKVARKKSDSQRSVDDFYSLSLDPSLSEDKKDDDTQNISESFASAKSLGRPKSKSSKPSVEDGQESSDITKTILFKDELQKQIESTTVGTPVMKPKRERRSSRSSRRSSSGSEKSLNKSKEELVKTHAIVESAPLKPSMTDDEFKTKMTSISKSLSQVINDVQIIERDIILKSELMSSAATASRSLEIISSLIKPLSEIHSIADAAKETSYESREVSSTLFSNLPKPLKVLQQSLTIIEKCIDVESDNKTLVKKTCIAFIETCGEEVSHLMNDITSITDKNYLLTEQKTLSEINSVINDMHNVIRFSVDTIKTKNLLSEASEIKTEDTTVETKHLKDTQKAIFELKSPLNSLLSIVETADRDRIADVVKVTSSEVILNDMSASIQDLQAALEQIESLSVKESTTSLHKYNTEIIETVMDSVLKLRSSFEQLPNETKNDEDEQLLKEALISIKSNLSEIATHIETIEKSVGSFDILQSDNKLEVLQKMAQILILLENNLPRLEPMSEVITHMDVFHKNLTRVLENVIESNEAPKYFTLMEICDAVSRLNSALKNIDSDNVLSLASLSNTLQIIQDTFIKHVFDSELNCSIISNITDVLLSIQEALNHAEEISLQLESERVQDISLPVCDSSKANVVVEHIDHTIAIINTVKSIETIKELKNILVPVLENICPVLEELKRNIASAKPPVMLEEEHISEMSDASFVKTLATPLMELNNNLLVLNQVIVDNIESLKDKTEVMSAIAEPLYELHTTLQILQQDVISQYGEDVAPYDVSVNIVSAVQNLQSCMVMVQEQPGIEGADEMSTLEDISGIKTTADTIPSDRLVLPTADEITVQHSVTFLDQEIAPSATAKALQTLNQHITVLQNPEVVDALDTLSEVSDYSSLKSVALGLGELHTGIEEILHPFVMENSSDIANLINTSKLGAIAEPMQELQQSLSVLDTSNIPIYEHILDIPTEQIYSVFQSISDFKQYLGKCIEALFPAMETADKTIEISNKVEALREVCENLKDIIETTKVISKETPVKREVLILEETVNNLLDATDVSKGIQIQQLKSITEELFEKVITVQEELIQFTPQNLEKLAEEARLIQAIDEIENNIAVLEQYDFVDLSRASEITSCATPQLAIELESEPLIQMDDILQNAANVLQESAKETPLADLMILEDFFKTCKSEFTIIRLIISKTLSHKRIIRLIQEFTFLQNIIKDFKLKRSELQLSDDIDGYLKIYFLEADGNLKTIQESLLKLICAQSELLFRAPINTIHNARESLEQIVFRNKELKDVVSNFINVIEVAKPILQNVEDEINEELKNPTTQLTQTDNKLVIEKMEEILKYTEDQSRSSSVDKPTKEVILKLNSCLQKHQDYKDATETGKKLIILKCLSEGTQILQAGITEKELENANKTKVKLEDNALKAVLTEMLEPLHALHSQLINIQEQVTSGVEEQSVSVDITTTESMIEAVSEIHKEIVYQIESAKSTIDKEDISLIKEADKEINAIQDSLKSLEHIPAAQELQEIAKPIAEVEKSLHSLVSSEIVELESAETLPSDMNTEFLHHIDQYIELIKIIKEISTVSTVIKIDELQQSVIIARELRDEIVKSELETTAEGKTGILQEKNTKLAQSLQNAITKLQTQVFDSTKEVASKLNPEVLNRFINNTAQLQGNLAAISGIQIAMIAPMELISGDVKRDVVKETPTETITDVRPTVAETIEPVVLEQLAELDYENKKPELVFESVTGIEASVVEVKEVLSVENKEIKNRETISLVILQESATEIESTEPIVIEQVESIKRQEVPEAAMVIIDSKDKLKEVEVESTKILKQCIEELIGTDMTETLDKLAVVINTEELNQTVNAAKKLLENIVSIEETTQEISTNIELVGEKVIQSELVQQLQNALLVVQEQIFDNYQHLETVCDANKLQKVADISVNLQTNLAAVVTVSDEVHEKKITEGEILAIPNTSVSGTTATQIAENVILENAEFVKPDKIANKQAKPPVSNSEEIAMGISTQVISQEDQDVLKEVHDIMAVSLSGAEEKITADETMRTVIPSEIFFEVTKEAVELEHVAVTAERMPLESVTDTESMMADGVQAIKTSESDLVQLKKETLLHNIEAYISGEIAQIVSDISDCVHLDEVKQSLCVANVLRENIAALQIRVGKDENDYLDEIHNEVLLEQVHLAHQLQNALIVLQTQLHDNETKLLPFLNKNILQKVKEVVAELEGNLKIMLVTTQPVMIQHGLNPVTENISNYDIQSYDKQENTEISSFENQISQIQQVTDFTKTIQEITILPTTSVLESKRLQEPKETISGEMISLNAEVLQKEINDIQNLILKQPVPSIVTELPEKMESKEINDVKQQLLSDVEIGNTSQTTIDIGESKQEEIFSTSSDLIIKQTVSSETEDLEVKKKVLTTFDQMSIHDDLMQQTATKVDETLGFELPISKEGTKEQKELLSAGKMIEDNKTCSISGQRTSGVLESQESLTIIEPTESEQIPESKLEIKEQFVDTDHCSEHMFEQKQQITMDDVSILVETDNPITVDEPFTIIQTVLAKKSEEQITLEKTLPDELSKQKCNINYMQQEIVEVTKPIVIDQSYEIKIQNLADEDKMTSGANNTVASDEVSKEIEIINLIESVYTCPNTCKEMVKENIITNIMEQESKIHVLETNIAAIIEPVNIKIEQKDLNKRNYDNAEISRNSELDQQKGPLEDQHNVITQDSASQKSKNEDAEGRPDTQPMDSSDSNIGYDNLIVKETTLPQNVVDVKTAQVDQEILNAKDSKDIMILDLCETMILEQSTSNNIVQTTDDLAKAHIEDEGLLTNKVNEIIIATQISSITEPVIPEEVKYGVELTEDFQFKEADVTSGATYPNNEAVVLLPVIDERTYPLLVAVATAKNTEQEILLPSKIVNLTTNLNATEPESIININTENIRAVELYTFDTQKSKATEDIVQESIKLTVDEIENAKPGELEKSKPNTEKPISAEINSDLDEVGTEIKLDTVQKLTKSTVPEMHYDRIKQPLEPDELLQHIEVFISGNVAEAIEELALVTNLPALKDTVEIAKELRENIAAEITDVRLEETTSLVEPAIKQAQLEEKLSDALITLQEKILNATEETTPVLPLEKLERISEAVIHLQENFKVASVSAIQTLETEFSESIKEDSMKQLECLLQEVTDKIDLSSSDRVSEDTEALRDSLDEVQTVIIKLKRDFDGANDTLNETLEDLECSVRSVQLQINEDSPPDLLKEACATLQLLVNNMSETNDTCVSEAVIKEINLKDALDNCSKETNETVQLLEKASHVDTQGQSKLADIVLSLKILTETMKSLKLGFIGNADTLIEKGIDIMQSLDHIEEKVFSIEKELDTAEDLPSSIKDTIVTAVHSVYGSLSNMRSTVSSTQKQYMFENYGKPSENILHSIKNLSSLTNVTKDESEKATLKKFSKSMRSVLNHFEDIKFYINLDKTARLPSDAAFTKIILDELKLNIQTFSVIEGLDTEFKNIINKALKCVEENLFKIEERSSLEVKEKIPIFKEVASRVLEVTSNIKVALENKLMKEELLLQQKIEDKQELLVFDSKDEKIETQELYTPKIQIQASENLAIDVETVEDQQKMGVEVMDAKEEGITKTHEECALPYTSKLGQEGQSANKVDNKSFEETAEFADTEKTVTVEKDKDDEYIPESIKQINSQIEQSQPILVLAKKTVIDSKEQDRELEEAGPSTRPDVLKKDECFEDLQNKDPDRNFDDNTLHKASQDEIKDSKIDKIEETTLKEIKTEENIERHVSPTGKKTLESSEVSILEEKDSNKFECSEDVQSVEIDFILDRIADITVSKEINDKLSGLTDVTEETINKELLIDESLKEEIQDNIKTATVLDANKQKILQESSEEELAIKEETTEIEVKSKKNEIVEKDIQAKIGQDIETIQMSEKEIEGTGKEGDKFNQKESETKQIAEKLDGCTSNVESTKFDKDETVAGTSKIAVEDIQTQKNYEMMYEKEHSTKQGKEEDKPELGQQEMEDAAKLRQSKVKPENKKDDESLRLENEKKKLEDLRNEEKLQKKTELVTKRNEEEVKLKTEKDLEEKRMKDEQEKEVDRVRLEAEKKQEELQKQEEEKLKVKQLADKQKEEEINLKTKKDLAEKRIKEEQEKETEKLRLEKEKQQQEFLRKEEELKRKELADKQKEEEIKVNTERELADKRIKEEQVEETERLRLQQEKKQQKVLMKEEEKQNNNELVDKQNEQENKLKEEEELKEKGLKEEQVKETERLRLVNDNKEQEFLIKEDEERKKKELVEKQKLKEEKELEEIRLKEEQDKETERLRQEDEKNQQEILRKEEELKQKELTDKQKQEEFKLKKEKEIKERLIREEQDKETEKMRLEDENKQQELLKREEEEQKKEELADKQKEEEIKLQKEKELEERRIREELDKETERLRLVEEEKQQELNTKEEELKKKELDKKQKQDTKLKEEKELEEKRLKEEQDKETERLRLEEEMKQQELLMKEEEERKKKELADNQKQKEIKLKEEKEQEEIRLKEDQDKETERLRLEEQKKQQELLMKEEEERKKIEFDKKQKQETKLKKEKEREEKRLKEEQDKERERLRLEEEKKQQELLMKEEEERKKKELADKQKQKEIKLKEEKELEEKRLKEEQDKETERLRLEEEKNQQEVLMKEEEERKKKELADKQKQKKIKLKQEKELEEKRLKEEQDKEDEGLRLEEEKKQHELVTKEEEDQKKKELYKKQKQDTKLKEEKELEEKRLNEEQDKETERLRLEEEKNQQGLLVKEEEERKKKELADKQKQKEIKLKQEKELEGKRLKEEQDKEDERLRLEEVKKQQELVSKEEEEQKKNDLDKKQKQDTKLKEENELEEKRLKEEQDKETERLRLEEQKKQQELLMKEEEERKKNELDKKQKQEAKLKKEKELEKKRIKEDQDKKTERLRLEEEKKQQELLKKEEEERKKKELADKQKQQEIKLKEEKEQEEKRLKEEQDKEDEKLRLEEVKKQQELVLKEEEEQKKKELDKKQKQDTKLKEEKELEEKRLKEEQETERLRLEEQKKQQELLMKEEEERKKKELVKKQKQETKLKKEKELEKKRIKEDQDKETEKLRLEEEKKQQELLKKEEEERKKKELSDKHKEIKLKEEKELEEKRLQEEQDKGRERLRLEEEKKQQELLMKEEEDRKKKEHADKQLEEEVTLKKEKELKEKRIKGEQEKETERLRLEVEKQQQEILKKEEDQKKKELADKQKEEEVKLNTEKSMREKRIKEEQDKESERVRFDEEKIQQELLKKEEEQKNRELDKKQKEETKLKKEKELEVKRKNKEKEIEKLRLEEEKKQQDLLRKEEDEKKIKEVVENQKEEDLKLMKVKEQDEKRIKDEQEKIRIEKEKEEASQLQKEKDEMRESEKKPKENLHQKEKETDELKEKKEEEYRFQKEQQELKEAEKGQEKKRIEDEKNKQNEFAIQLVKEEADRLKKEKTDKRRLKKGKDDKGRQEKQKKDTEKSLIEANHDLEFKKKHEESDRLKPQKEKDAEIDQVTSENGTQKINKEKKMYVDDLEKQKSMIRTDNGNLMPDDFKKGAKNNEHVPEKSDKGLLSKQVEKEYIHNNQIISEISPIKLLDETMIKKDSNQADKYSRRFGNEIKFDEDRLRKSYATSDTSQHYIKEYHYEPSVRPQHEDREKPRFIDHNHRDYTMEFARPSTYREKTFEVDNINFEKNSGRGHIYKANNLIMEAQLRASAPPRAIVSESNRCSEPLERRSEVKHRSKALSEARSILSEKRTSSSRDIKRKPVFSTFLTDRTAVEGSRVKLTCSVLSSSDPKVTWFKNGVLLDNKLKYRTKMIDGLITLEVLNAVPSDSAEYSCTVENENGSINSSANLKVYPSFEASPIPPTFTRSIRDTYHLAENELVLECRIRGQPLPTITWLKDDRVVNMNERFQAYYLADGVCRLAISFPTPEDSGKYTCKAENSVWSDQITHVVNFTGQESRLSPNIATIERSRFNRQAIESRRPHFGNVLTDYKVTRGGTIGLQVEIKGLPTRVEWLREGRSVIETYTNAKTYVEQELYTLALSDVTERESGMFTCRAWSSHGTVDMNAAITVVQPNEMEGKPAMIVGRPEKDLLISVGEDLNISFRVQGEPKPKVIFMKGIRDITNSQRVCKMTSDDYVKFTVKRSVISDAGTYCILARNAYGCDRAFVTAVVRQRASSENLISDWTYPMDDSAITVADRKYKSVPERIPAEPSVVDGGSNWVSIAWPKPDPSDTAPVLAYKVESWLVGKEGGARWVELGITPLNSFDAFNLKQGEEYHIRVTPRNRYGWGEAVQTSSPFGVGLSGDRPEFVDILPGQLKVLIGETANLSCSVKGKPTPEVVWMKNGHELEDEDPRVKTSFNGFDCSLVINGINPDDEARYSCEATNAHGRASTYARLAVVTDRLIWEADAKLKRERSADAAGEYPPQFTMRLRDRRVQATYPVRLTCQVVGCPPPSVTWYKDGEDVILNSRHTKSQDEHFHTLEIAPTTLEDGGVYEVMARNSCGAVSCHCNLVVDKGIRAYVAPEFCCGLEPLYRLQEGDELRISAVVEAYPTVGVTWYRDGVRLRPSRRAIMTLDRDGQIELALAFVTPRDAGVYTCTASNEVGRATTSGKVEVIGDASMIKKKTPPMLISPDVPYSKEPMFIRKPRSSEAREGDTVIIQCEVVGDPKPDVYWLRDFLKPDYYRDATHFKRIGNGPEYRFEIPHAKLDYTGAYSVVARNVHGEAKAIISLQILAKDPSSSEEPNIRYGRVDVIPRFKRDLTDLLCYDGDAIEFECRVSGHPEPDIRWFHYTELIRENPDFEWSIDDGTVRLKIKQVTAEDEGTYLCEASNNLGKATTSACLVVYPPGEPNTLSQRLRRPPALLSAASTPRSTPRSTPARSVSRTPGPDPRRLCSPSRQMPPKFYTYPFNKVVEEGDHVVFQCAVKGLPAPWATWDKDGVIITPSSRVTIKEKDEILRILEIEEVTIEDVGVYRVTLENDLGRVEASARLEVITQKGKFYAGVRSYSASPRKSLAFRRRPSRQD